MVLLVVLITSIFMLYLIAGRKLLAVTCFFTVNLPTFEVPLELFSIADPWLKSEMNVKSTEEASIVLNFFYPAVLS